MAHATSDTRWYQLATDNHGAEQHRYPMQERGDAKIDWTFDPWPLKKHIKVGV